MCLNKFKYFFIYPLTLVDINLCGYISYITGNLWDWARGDIQRVGQGRYVETGPGEINRDRAMEDVWRLGQWICVEIGPWGQGRFVESWSEENCGDWAMRDIWRLDQICLETGPGEMYREIEPREVLAAPGYGHHWAQQDRGREFGVGSWGIDLSTISGTNYIHAVKLVCRPSFLVK